MSQELTPANLAAAGIPQELTPAAKLAGGYMLTEQDVGELFAVSKYTLRNWRTTGQGPAFVKLGRCVRYTPEAVRAFMSAEKATA